MDVTNGLSAVNLRLGSRWELPELTLETAAVDDVEVFGESAPIWVGLERVPDAALLAELRGRGYIVGSEPGVPEFRSG